MNVSKSPCIQWQPGNEKKGEVKFAESLSCTMFYFKLLLIWSVRVLGLLGFLDIAGILMSPLQWPDASCSSLSLMFWCYRYLVNAYQTGFGLVVCVLEAKPVGVWSSFFFRAHQSPWWFLKTDWRYQDDPGSTRVAWKQCQTGEGTSQRFALICWVLFAKFGVGLSFICSICSIFVRLPILDSKWFTVVDSCQAQRFIHEFAKFLTTFGGSSPRQSLGHTYDLESHRLRISRSWLQGEDCSTSSRLQLLR